MPLSTSEPQQISSSSLKQGLISVFKNPKFLILWGGQIFSQLADKVYLVLMIALITSYFQKANQPISGWVSIIMVAFTIPAVFFGSLAGVYVDRWAKKTVLVLSNLLRGALVLILPVLLHFHSTDNNYFGLPSGFLILLLITFLVSTLTQFFAPAEQATLTLIMKPRDLLAANSIYTTTVMAVLIIGFALGDPLLELANRVTPWRLDSNTGAELLVGGAYLLAGLLLLLMSTGEKKVKPESNQISILQDIQEGLRYLYHNYRVRNALIQLVILFSVFAALAVLAVRLAEIIPGMKAEEFGFLLASCGVGLGLSAGILGNWGYKISHSRLSLWGTMGVSMALIGLSLFTQYLWLEVLMTIFLGAFAACIGVPMQTTIQAETPPELRGKIFGLQNNVVNIALSLPLALAGIGETLFGLKSVLMGLAAIVILGRVAADLTHSL